MGEDDAVNNYVVGVARHTRRASPISRCEDYVLKRLDSFRPGGDFPFLGPPLWPRPGQATFGGSAAGVLTPASRRDGTAAGGGKAPPSSARRRSISARSSAVSKACSWWAGGGIGFRATCGVPNRPSFI